MSIVTEEDVEKALKRLRVTTKTTAEAKGHLVLMAGRVKSVLAKEAAKQVGSSATAAKEAALASEAYEQALLAESAATEIYEDLKLERETCIAWIEVWRSEEASNRVTDRSHR